ncbi:LOW QUALITY PROTEIN: hypothetical protein PHMEG_00011335 [Phytophthora megakarya]|uniref:Uncharacterized protein n=1 Tax=Phytophthora megakarya TaxID=4795 RepID=A0A225WDI1_9STRA|nr:LOW QUALITY PROTEIN: hypothetical protein PHMEG_00011335 [Phytophthora megakarya]
MPSFFMLGDVSGAFRHAPVHEDAVHRFICLFEGYVVIDLLCLFGANLGQLHGNVWYDGHTCVEISHSCCCVSADIPLHRVIATVLGPTTINDKKFTPWRPRNKALSLIWDTITGSVSIPYDKLEKVQQQVASLISSSRATKAELNQLLGILRHITAYFRLLGLSISGYTLRHSPDRRSDYKHFKTFAGSKQSLRIDAGSTIFQWLNSLAVLLRACTSTWVRPGRACVFSNHNDVNLFVYNTLLTSWTSCIMVHILTSSTSGSFRVHSGNTMLGRHWAYTASDNMTYVCIHIDNTSAVAWASNRASRHHIVQLYNRLLSFVEFEHKLVFTAENIPGRLNVMANAGSRAWTKTHPLWCRSPTSIRRSLKRMGATLCGAAIARTITTKYRAHWIQWKEFTKFMCLSPWLNKTGRSSSEKLANFAIYLWR